MGFDETRVALVTGASRGIGYAMAKLLAGEGFHVIATARTIAGLEELDDEIRALGGQATLSPFDMTDFAAIDRLGAAIHGRWGRLDALFANAGVLGQLAPLGHIEAETWQTVIDVNLTANWRLIRSMDPLLRAAPAARAVFVTSGAATSFNAYWGPYSVSKAALDALVKIYVAETTGTQICTNLYSPGPVRTALRAKAMPGEDPLSLTTPEQAARACLALFSPECHQTGRILAYDEQRQLVDVTD